jgi:hypothetical protein
MAPGFDTPAGTLTELYLKKDEDSSEKKVSPTLHNFSFSTFKTNIGLLTVPIREADSKWFTLTQSRTKMTQLRNADINSCIPVLTPGFMIPVLFTIKRR